RYGHAVYRIKVENPMAFHRGVATLEIDNVVQSIDEIPLVDDGRTHAVRILLGDRPVKNEPERGDKARAGRTQ
ncbi:MAG: hypothetical protein ACREBC_19155, partial [Pyrinomonadaceae bacterium]